MWACCAISACTHCPGVRLTLVCTDPHTPYSGMLPGYVAGHYSYDDVHIDLGRLAAFAGARFICGEVTGIDRANCLTVALQPAACPFRLRVDQHRLHAATRAGAGCCRYAVAVKPIVRFNQRWLALLDRVRGHPGPMMIAVVGGGAGGVELLLAMQYRLQQELRGLQQDPNDLVFHLFTSDAQFCPPTIPGCAGVSTPCCTSGVCGCTVHPASRRCPRMRSVHGRVVRRRRNSVGDAGRRRWLTATGLALDTDGFCGRQRASAVGQRRTHFAAGDVASIQGRPLEKAGVFAVRMGRPLAENLRRAVLSRPLHSYRPQRRWLALISTGDRYAVASRGALGFAGRWVWRWKDWIDRRFMQRFAEFPAMAPAGGPAGRTTAFPLSADESRQAVSAMAMRCGGCGAKVGASRCCRARWRSCSRCSATTWWSGCNHRTMRRWCGCPPADPGADGGRRAGLKQAPDQRFFTGGRELLLIVRCYCLFIKPVFQYSGVSAATVGLVFGVGEFLGYGLKVC